MRRHAELVDQLRVTRIRLGLSYEKLAELSGYSAPTIWWLERKSTRPRKQTMIDLAQAMGVALDKMERNHERHIRSAP